MSQPIVSETASPDSMEVEDILPFERKPLTAADIILAKELLFDKYTLEDEYPYKDTVRSFKWDAIRKCLAFIENLQYDANRWAIFQNYKNVNREVLRWCGNTRRMCTGALPIRWEWNAISRCRCIFLRIRWCPNATDVTGRWCLSWARRAVSIACHRSPSRENGGCRAATSVLLSDSTQFNHVVVVDRGDQNIATLERLEEGTWAIRSMNPATTGMHRPPYAQETPLGMFVVQQKKSRMVFLKDGSAATGGYAPYASRFYQRSLYSRGAGQRASHGDD